MSKTLTEQWKDGKLEKGTYWCVSSWTDEIRMFYFEGDYFIDCDVPLDDDNIEEVLAPVPSYDEYQDIIQQNVNQEAAIETYIEDIKRLQEQIDDLMGCLIAIRDRGCEKDFDCILSADITLQNWGVK